MSLSKRDYINLAACIRTVNDTSENDAERNAVRAIAVKISNWIARERPGGWASPDRPGGHGIYGGFDTALFLRNCGVAS
jgi:hypothetical protein